MPHELSFTDVDGVRTADFFEVGSVRTAWHREGVLLPEAPSLDRALEVARLDYPVEKVPVTLTLRTEGGDTFERQSTKAFVTLRTDRNVELGSVGPDYHVVQNRDAFRATIGPLLDAGLLVLETGGVLRDGADAWLLGRFDLSKFGPVCQEVFGNEVLPFALVKVNHSGRRNNEIVLTPTRVVCANTLGMAEQEVDGGHSRAASIRHTGDAEARMVEAAETLFGGIVERYEVIARQYRLLKGFYLDAAAFRSLVIEPAIGVHPAERQRFNPEARMAAAVVERWEKKFQRITWLWTNGKGHVADGSAWEAYNGLVEAIDHDAELFPLRAGVYRTQALMEGTLRDMKQASLNALVAAAEGR